ncbi:MAG: hypothetical protein ACREQI_13020 [Candidatus Binataceae bacterium]
MPPVKAFAGAPVSMPMNQILVLGGWPAKNGAVERIAPQTSHSPGSGTIFEGVYRLAAEAPWDYAAAEATLLSRVCGNFGAACQRLAGATGAVPIPAYTGDWFRGQLIRTRSLESGETFQWSYASSSGKVIWSPVYTWINDYGGGSVDFFGGCWNETIAGDTVASHCGNADEWQSGINEEWEFIVGPFGACAGGAKVNAGMWTIRFYDDGAPVYASTLDVEQNNSAAPAISRFERCPNSSR